MTTAMGRKPCRPLSLFGEPIHTTSIVIYKEGAGGLAARTLSAVRYAARKHHDRSYSTQGDARSRRPVRWSRTGPSAAGLGGEPPNARPPEHRVCRRRGPVRCGCDDHIASPRLHALERPPGGRAAGRDHGGGAVVRNRARTTALSDRIVEPTGGRVQGHVGRVRAHLRRDDGVGHRPASRTAAGGLTWRAAHTGRQVGLSFRAAIGPCDETSPERDPNTSRPCAALG